jgi:acetoin utilization protein AcuC
VNLPVAPGTGDVAWLETFRGRVPPLVERFAPDVLVTQLGCDTHATDPLAHLALTTYAYDATAAALHELAHESAGGRWVATGGGGYRWAEVVPRAWTIAFAEMAGASLPDELPAAWVERAETQLRGAVPSTLRDLSHRDGEPRGGEPFT